MTQLAPLITGFLRDYMPNQRGYSQQTCETYAFSFKLLFEFTAKQLLTRPSLLAIEDLDAPMIVAFLTHIEQDRGNSVSTRNLRLAAVKAFMRYVEYRVPSALEQIGRVHAIPVKRHDQKLIRHLTMQEVRAILNAPDVTTRSGVRDRAMMHLCFAGGLRVSELVGILTANLTLQYGASVTIRGKGRKERCLPLWKETARDLRAWLSVRGDVPVPELFVNARGEPMTRAGFEYVLDKHVRKAAKTCVSLRDRNVSPHQLRHSCAVMLLQATHDIRKVALWLGHADIRTTEIYLRMDPSEKLEAVEAVVHPELRRGRFKAPDALIASLLSDVVGPT
ncbi:tyrosine-type recombinase/integrase [Roseibium aggregatum]|jgi:integrase/recombinase XerD|uniref:tyrosine-type recombinase/integrase n=1 Tax=Roseibium aggregatum TaxID=187304 RepID=UPI001E2DF36D|nr:tyrosine-type recombinase/integrase [Roseibium aggregatum]UES41892.1 tyrosine-type recombinase/integrase [Roseibium aggregatum]